MSGSVAPHRLRQQALDRLISLLPGKITTEILPLLDSRVPDPEGVVIFLLRPREREAAITRLRERRPRAGVGPASTLLQRLLPVPSYREARSIARAAFLRGRTDWLRFALGRMPGRAPPDMLLPLHPDVVYRGAGFRDFDEFLLPDRDPPGDRDEARYWSFESALAFVRSRGLLGQSEWHAFSRGDLAKFVGRRPGGIPGCPYRIFEDRYPGIRGWVGARNDLPAVSGYMPYKKARRLVWRLGFASIAGWRNWVRGRGEHAAPRPGNLPALPEVVYPDCWRGMNSWLGRREGPSPESRGHRPYREARAFARDLGLANVGEWRAYLRGERPELPSLPDDIPAGPDIVYEGCGFRGYGDWLGTDRTGSCEFAWRPFEEAREFAQSLELRSETEWRDWVAGRISGKPQRPPDVPSIPPRTYRNKGWTDWGDFLGTGNIHPSNREFRDYASARAFARSLGLANVKEWLAFTRGAFLGLDLPPDIPANPESRYRDRGWKDWNDFLDSGHIHGLKRNFRSFAEARAYVRKLDVSSAGWRDLCKGEIPGKSLPSDIPRTPDLIYRDKGWVDWPDFLGSAWRTAKPKDGWMPFREARRLVRSLRLFRKDDYHAWLDGELPDLREPPGNLPRTPKTVYAKQGFKDWWDFLGRRPGERKDRPQYRPFRQARAFARSLGLPGKTAWEDWYTGRRPGPPRPPDIPTNPNRIYRHSGWAGWRDFLGKGLPVARAASQANQGRCDGGRDGVYGS